jgi:hypothetical protein
MMIFFKKTFPIITYILLFEILSFFGFILPEFRQISFFILIILFLFLSIKDFRLGVLILLIELIIGSKGYLFYFEYEGILVSLRIAFWLILLSVFFSKFVLDLKTRSVFFDFFSSFKKRPFYTKYKNTFFLLSLVFLFIFWGFFNALMNKNEFNNIFFDLNGWLYFLLIFPFFYYFKLNHFSFYKNKIEEIGVIFASSLLWLAVKTYFLLYVFSHNILSIMPELYKWVRVSGVGEITKMDGNFYRIFFQSHVFFILAFFLLMGFIVFKIKQNKKFFNKEIAFLVFILGFFLGVILITFSRSFWVGLFSGLCLFYIYLFFIKKEGVKRLFRLSIYLILSFLISVTLLIAVVKFPFPGDSHQFNAAEMLSERARQFSGEAGVSSRWLLLPGLWGEIKKAPVLGQGYGKVITYKTQDPRALESSADGTYTTFAFEWGWLDIWLKLGFIGLISYSLLLLKMIIDGLKSNKFYQNSLAIALFSVAVISFFSPYMNHPLGIGFVIVYMLMLDRKISNSPNKY